MITPRYALAGLLACAIGACSSSAGTGSQAGAGSPGSTAASSSAAPVATRRPVPTPEPLHAPIAATIDRVPAEVLSLGNDAAPIDITFAFGSIWVANHHKNSVTRLDPETMATQASIKVGNGPAWFIVTDDAIWLSEQQGHGLSRIDPQANTAEPHTAGQWPTCGRGVFAFGSLWQPACDAHQIMRIDPVTRHSVDVSTGDVNSIVLANDRLIVSGPDGIARLDPDTNALTAIGGPGGWSQGYGGETVWVAGETELYRVRPTDAKVMATLPISRAQMFLVNADHAWVARDGPELYEIDLATNRILRTLHIDPWPASMVFVDGRLWVTNFEHDSVARLDL